MADLASQVSLFATRVGTEIKGVKASIGDLTTLSTTDKTAVVKAINEVFTKAGTNATEIARVDSAVKALEGVVAASTNIDDTNVSAATTYSSSKIVDVVNEAKKAVKDDLLGGAGEAYDTLKELGDLIDANKDSVEALQALAAGHVKFDAAQELTEVQKKQARDNIAAASVTEVEAANTAAATADGKAVAAQTAADGAKSAADAAQADVDALEAAVGDVNTDFVAAFEAALA